MSSASRLLMKQGVCLYEAYEHYDYESCYAGIDKNNKIRFFVSPKKKRALSDISPQAFQSKNINDDTRWRDAREMVSIKSVKLGLLLLGWMEVGLDNGEVAHFETNKGFIKLAMKHLPKQ